MLGLTRWSWLLVALVGVLALPAISFDFVWDDRPMMLQSDVIHDVSNLGAVFAHRTAYAVNSAQHLHNHSGLQTYRPLTIATFMLDSLMFGRAPWGFHLTSILLHMLVVLVVQVLARQLAPAAPAWVPVLAGAWFAVCPFLVEAYIWINGRSDVLATLFGALVVCVHLRARDASSPTHRVRLELLVAALGLACLLSKETGIAWLATLPLLPGTRRPTWRTIVGGMIAPTAAVSTYAALRVSALEGLHVSADAQLWRAIVIAPYVIVEALSEMLAPRYTTVRWLSFELRSVGVVGFSVGLIALIGLVGGAWAARKRVPSLFYGVALSVVSLAPVALIAADGWPGFGRYVYTAAACIAPGLAVGVFELSQSLRVHVGERSIRLLRAGGIAYLLVLVGLSFVSAAPFASEHALYESWIAGTPDQPHGYKWLGLTYMEEEDFARAFAMLDLARLRDSRDETIVWYQITSVQASGQPTAVTDFAERVAPNYRSARLHLLLTVRLAATNPTRALEHARRCLELDSGSDQCRFWFARLTGTR